MAVRLLEYACYVTQIVTPVKTVFKPLMLREMVEATENISNCFKLREILEEWEIILWWQQVESKKEKCKSVQGWQDYDI